MALVLYVQAMPRPGRVTHLEDDELAAAVEQSLADQSYEEPSPPPPQHGISFANMTKMGFAASGWWYSVCQVLSAVNHCSNRTFLNGRFAYSDSTMFIHVVLPHAIDAYHAVD